MQIYIGSHESESELLDLLQQAIDKQQLQDDLMLKVLPPPAPENQRILESIDPGMVTVLVTTLGAGGAGTVFITKLARVLEVWLNSRKVEVKLEHNGTLVELSGPAGHIEKILQNILH